MRARENFDPGFVLLLAAAVVAGFTLQTEWAIQHDFDDFSARVFGTALVLLVVFLGIRAACRRCVAIARGNDFNWKYGQSLLLLSVVPAFFVIENGLLAAIGATAYTAMVVRHVAVAAKVDWLRRALWRAEAAVSPLLRRADRAPVSCLIEDDVDGRRLTITMATRDPGGPSPAQVRRRAAMLAEELANVARFQAVRVDARGVRRIDERLRLLLEPVSGYAARAGIDKVEVAVQAERVDALSALVPADRFAAAAY